MTSPERARQESTLRVATYNVHRCIGVDGRHDPDRVARVLVELDADVVALQELNHRAGVPGDVDQLAHLAAATGHEAIPGPTLLTDRGHQGNAILTRLPVVAVRREDLSVARREPRGALDVDLALDGERSLRVVVTHLGLGMRERRHQLERLRVLLGERREEPTLLLGDLNGWARPRSDGGRLGRGFGGGVLATFPSRWPVLALDRILARPTSLLREIAVHVTRASLVASDHLPLRAEVELP